MGLSIHYSGSIKDRSLLPQLGAEMKDICENLGWDYHYFEADEKGSAGKGSILPRRNVNRYSSLLPRRDDCFLQSVI